MDIKFFGGIAIHEQKCRLLSPLSIETLGTSLGDLVPELQFNTFDTLPVKHLVVVLDFGEFSRCSGELSYSLPKLGVFFSITL